MIDTMLSTIVVYMYNDFKYSTYSLVCTFAQHIVIIVTKTNISLNAINVFLRVIIVSNLM